MKIYIDGNTQVNRYYVQTLCMIFFPNCKFSEDEPETADTPVLKLNVIREENGNVKANAVISADGKSAASEKLYLPREKLKFDRLLKMAVGDAVLTACGELFGYRPAWGMLTGVRPSKVATEMLQDGISKTKAKKILSTDFFVIPKKAALAVDVALNEKKIIGDPGKKDCSMYISIPFCPTRCAYCSFVSYSSKKLLSLIPDYLDRLFCEIKNISETIKRLGLNLKTIYIGGGTPSILSETQLEALLSTVEENIDVASLEEYTLEAGRPDTITSEKLKIAKKHGVNRVCVNPQILCDEVLRGVGRAHTADDFFRAFSAARESGIPIINTDLIAGLPGDRFPTFAASFDQILALKPENVTVHTLCIKKAAEMRQTSTGLYNLRGGDTGKCIDYSQIKAIHEGYKPYYMYRQKNAIGNFENVGMALDGCEGLYNIYMMEEVHSIFAAGAGAVTKLVDYKPVGSDTPYITRLFNPKYPYEYLSDTYKDEKYPEIEKFYAERGLI